MCPVVLVFFKNNSVKSLYSNYSMMLKIKKITLQMILHVHQLSAAKWKIPRCSSRNCYTKSYKRAM